ncbi:MAG TPA: hypothetical protein IAC04_08545 [Candidatus Coprenecus stercoravium]|uniref:DUF6850 domain-containing protein n=1 Tax=Candidatus Coprenecus stercoravium TaxID=2840735 RepID=A0A9D2KAQ4_9BACT|nr:hypothetical protein [Candidatus Coprenecus stercoravium]
MQSRQALMVLALLPGFMSDARAQADDWSAPDCVERYSRYSRVERANFWNAGSNVAGVRQDSVTVSYAELSGMYAGGGFHDYSDGGSLWGAGARAMSITHLERISLTGSFYFGHSSGYGMCGSMSGRPGYYPFDVLEFTPGTKTRQVYAFSGGISADMGRKWRIGAKIDYKASDYTKRKDLRHTDYLLDMTVAPSALYRQGDFALGFSAIFSKNSETINAEVLGISDSTYYAFLDKGLMYGAYESWEGGGVHLSESGVNGFPARELLYGCAVQVQWKGFYAEMEYLYGDGKAGEKEVIWFRFPSHRAALRIGYAFGEPERRHFLRLSLKGVLQYNNESVIQDVTENGVTLPVVYGYNRLLSRMILSANPEYELDAGSFALTAGMKLYAGRSQASPMFPYIFMRDEFFGQMYASASYTVKGFDIAAGLCAGAGFREEDGDMSVTSVRPEQEPFRLDKWNDIKSEYRTAPRVTAELGLRYRFWKGLFAGAGVRYTHGFNIRFLSGADRWTGTLMIGCEF